MQRTAPTRWLLVMCFVWVMCLFPSITPAQAKAGRISEYIIPTPTCVCSGITLGPDGNLWFGESLGRKIGRITPQGHITEFSILSAADGYGSPDQITTGPDGNLWFTEGGNGVNTIGRITLKGKITLYPIPTQNSSASDITAGPNGTLWFVETTGN